MSYGKYFFEYCKTNSADIKSGHKFNGVSTVIMVKTRDMKYTFLMKKGRHGITFPHGSVITSPFSTAEYIYNTSMKEAFNFQRHTSLNNGDAIEYCASSMDSSINDTKNMKIYFIANLVPINESRLTSEWYLINADELVKIADDIFTLTDRNFHYDGKSTIKYKTFTIDNINTGILFTLLKRKFLDQGERSVYPTSVSKSPEYRHSQGEIKDHPYVPRGKYSYVPREERHKRGEHSYAPRREHHETKEDNPYAPRKEHYETEEDNPYAPKEERHKREDNPYALRGERHERKDNPYAPRREHHETREEDPYVPRREHHGTRGRHRGTRGEHRGTRGEHRGTRGHHRGESDTTSSMHPSSVYMTEYMDFVEKRLGN